MERLRYGWMGQSRTSQSEDITYESLGIKVALTEANVFIPFSYGPLSCVGRNLAWLEIRIVASVFLSRFDMKLAD